MRHFLAALTAIFVILVPAQADTPFTVVGVPIDASADNALEAQTAAMRQGQVAAVYALLDRITYAEDRSLLPEITNDEAAQLIAGLQVRNEQRSATRYLGDLTVSFDPRAVRSWLNNYDVPFVEGQDTEILVLPVLVTSSGGYWLWNQINQETGEETENPWLSEWRNGGYQYWLAPVSAPSDNAGRLLIDGSTAASMDEGVLRGVAQAYGVSRIAVMVADRSAGGVRVEGRVFDFPRNGEGTSQAIPTIAAQSFAGAARRFMRPREDAWKAQAIVRGNESGEMNITVLYNSLSEWRQLQSALTGASLIESAQLNALAPTGASMTLEYRGSLSQLERELGARGTRLEDDPELGLVLRAQ